MTSDGIPAAFGRPWQPAARRACVALLCLAATSSAQRDQSSGDALPCCATEAEYTAVVRAFGGGDWKDSSLAIERANPEDVNQAIGALDLRDGRLLETAAVLHVMVAAAQANVANFEGMLAQLRTSDAVVRRIPHPDPLFVGAWYVASAALCVDAGYFNQAQALVRHGLLEKTTAAPLLVAAGIVEETEADVNNRILAAHPSNGPAYGLGRAIDRQLKAAEQAYREAVGADPASEEARLRLGRVLAVQEDADEARQMLGALATGSRDARIVYLAHLFLAEIAGRRNETAQAIREYLAARAASPASPDAYIGLSNLATRAGDLLQARDYIRQWTARPHGGTADPWVTYRAGTDQLDPALKELLRIVSK